MTTYTVIETNRNYEERVIGTYRSVAEATEAAKGARWAVSIVQVRA